MLFEIITAVTASETDIEIVGAPDGSASLVEAARRADADIVILQGDGADRSGCEALLFSRPAAKVLEIIDRDRRAVLHELQPMHIPLGEASPETLLSAIRSACRPVHPTPH
jgi:DNA-binding NarL/FixJ family response regulator